MTHSAQASEPPSSLPKVDMDFMKQHCAKLISSLRAKHSLLAKPSGRGKTTLKCSSKVITIAVTLESITTNDFVGTLQLSTLPLYSTPHTEVSWEYSTSISATRYDSLWLQLMDMAELVLPELALLNELE